MEATAADEAVAMGPEMPRLASIRPLTGLSIEVAWASGTRAGTTEVVDLTPMVDAFAFYRPLRQDPALFRTATLADGGAVIEWGAIDMAAATVERLACEQNETGPALQV